MVIHETPEGIRRDAHVAGRVAAVKSVYACSVTKDGPQRELGGPTAEEIAGREFERSCDEASLRKTSPSPSLANHVWKVSWLLRWGSSNSLINPRQEETD